MPPSKQVTGEAVAEILSEMERPFGKTTDIADSLNVTPQTVRNNSAVLKAHPRIEKGHVGQASVYWLSETNSHTDADIPPDRRERDRRLFDLITVAFLTAGFTISLVGTLTFAYASLSPTPPGTAMIGLVAGSSGSILAGTIVGAHILSPYGRLHSWGDPDGSAAVNT